MAQVTSDAIILQSFRYGDTSRIVRLLTREHGVQAVIAKGATRPHSRYHLLEPFTEGVASLYIRSTRELQTLSGFDVSRSRQALGRDLLRFGGASLVAELVLRTASEEPQPDLFDALSTGLDRLVTAPAATLEIAVLAVTWRLITVLGFEPALDACLNCAASIQPHDVATFDYAAGGVRCGACEAGLPGRPLPAHARLALASLCRGDVTPIDITEGHWRLLARYLEHHLLEGASLRSLQFLADSMSVSGCTA